MTLGVSLVGVSPLAAADSPATPGPSPALAWPLSITVSAPAGSAWPLSVLVSVPTPAVSWPLSVAVFSPGVPPAVWRPVVTLGGVDVSLRLVGAIRIEAGEGEARICSLAMVPTAGVIAPASYIGRAVAVEFAGAGAGGVPVNPQRLFTGVVDTSAYDINAGVLSLDCTDQRQEVLSNTPRAWIDANISGYYSPVLSGEPENNYDYATARLATVPAALDLDAWQRPRVTPWAAGAVYAAHGSGDVIDDSLSFGLPSRADLLNVIEARYEYRFSRLRSRTIMTGWHLAGDYRAKSTLPLRANVDEVLHGISGWVLDGGIGYGAPPVGSQSWNGGIYLMTAQNAALQCISWAARHRTRWVQTVTERYVVRARNAVSVAAIGEALVSKNAGRLEASFDSATWLSDYSTEPALTRTSTGDEAYDYGAADSDRAASNAALLAVSATARVDVLSSHRSGWVRYGVPLRADYDLTQTQSVDATMADGRRVRGAGKVSRVMHVMDLDAGAATTTITLAISGHGAAGVQPDTAPYVPTPLPDTSPAPPSTAWTLRAGTYVGQRVGQADYDDETMVGYTTNLVADDATGTYDPFGDPYPVRFRVEEPALTDTDTDPLDTEQTITLEVAVPQDLFEVTA